ncbi:MAG: OsmC family protein [Bacteroidota bacterium]
MSIVVQWLKEGYQFEAENRVGGKIRIDGDGVLQGIEGGIAPLELLLAGIGACSAVDVVMILKKQRQVIESLEVQVDPEKVKNEIGYSEYKTIHMHYTLTGDIDTNKAQKALELSITKYCSVSKALEKSSEISFSFEIRS